MLAVLGAVLVVAAAAVAFTVVAYRREWQWTGLPADSGDGTPESRPRPAKTLWDWLQLFIVPLVLALAAFGLNAAQVDRDRKQEQRRAAQERRLEERRTANDRASAEDRAREETLTTYLQEMSDLMTPGGRTSADTQTLAQTLTLVALRRLDGARKGLVVQFLYEADLIAGSAAAEGLIAPAGCGSGGRHPCRRIGVKVYLDNADLRNAVMPSSLGSLELSGPASRALGGAEVVGWFDGADLRNADFRGGRLQSITFRRTDLRGANFSGAHLDGTSFSGACLSSARFDRVEVGESADFSDTEGRGVNFSNARLTKATFKRARLTDVRLSGATTTGIRWPPDWTPTGLRLNDTEARGLCGGRQE
jgi:uncharacterized protein YjbI with pentapeptide repeats